MADIKISGKLVNDTDNQLADAEQIMVQVGGQTKDLQSAINNGDIGGGGASEADTYIGNTSSTKTIRVNTTDNSVAEGKYTKARGDYSHAEGSGTIADGDSSHTEGDYTKTGDYLYTGEGPAYDFSDEDIHCHTLNYGDCAHAEGGGCVAKGKLSHAEGYDTYTTGLGAHAEGDNSGAYGRASHAEGKSLASGTYAHSEGVNDKTLDAYLITSNSTNSNTIYAKNVNTNIGDYVFIDDVHTTSDETWKKPKVLKVTGKNSSSITVDQKVTTLKDDYVLVISNGAIGYASHSEGTETTAVGAYSHAEGYNTKASNEASHAEGISTEASGEFSHAEGGDTKARGYCSHAEGIGTRTNNAAEHAEGQYNNSHTNDTEKSKQTIHSVGIGTRDDIRKNAHEIMQNGDHYLGSGRICKGDFGKENVRSLDKHYRKVVVSANMKAMPFDIGHGVYRLTTLDSSEADYNLFAYNIRFREGLDRIYVKGGTKICSHDSSGTEGSFVYNPVTYKEYFSGDSNFGDAIISTSEQIEYYIEDSKSVDEELNDTIDKVKANQEAIADIQSKTKGWSVYDTEEALAEFESDDYSTPEDYDKVYVITVDNNSGNRIFDFNGTSNKAYIFLEVEATIASETILHIPVGSMVDMVEGVSIKYFNTYPEDYEEKEVVLSLQYNTIVHGTIDE